MKPPVAFIAGNAVLAAVLMGGHTVIDTNREATLALGLLVTAPSIVILMYYGAIAILAGLAATLSCCGYRVSGRGFLVSVAVIFSATLLVAIGLYATPTFDRYDDASEVAPPRP